VTRSKTSPDRPAVEPDGRNDRRERYTTLSGGFADPGPLDAHTVTVDWGDGTSATTLNLAAGTLTFTTPAHRYLNNRPADAAYPSA